MTDRVPQTIILVPGPWKTPAEVLAALDDGDVEATLWDDASVTAGAVRVDVVTAQGFGPALSVGRAGPLVPEFLAAAEAPLSKRLALFVPRGHIELLATTTLPGAQLRDAAPTRLLADER